MERDPLEGRRALGRYELIRRIGAGAASVVYQGRDPRAGQAVAVKVCTSGNAKLRRRFLLEAQIAAGLRHPNVVQVYELGSADDLPYLVQELLDGEDLSDLLKRRALLTLPERLRLLIQVARGLQHAHEQGVLHRDVKPRNIRVLPDGTVKILDFGFARLVDRSFNLTTKGVAVGTLGYVSPEQFRGATVDGRTDVFSFGVLAYELFAGMRPFAGGGFPEIVRKLLEEDPRPLAQVVPERGPRLSALIAACLAKDPARRPSGFQEVVRELEEVLE
jgi:serine/threonine protein kinase